MQILKKYFDNLSDKQLDQLEALYPLYQEWNEKINVISRKDMDNFYERHVLHSLAIATQFTFEKGNKIMDLGTGGGFPGIPLAILFPLVVVTGAHEILAVLVSLIQFPLFAGVFAFGIRRCPIPRVLMVLAVA